MTHVVTISRPDYVLPEDRQPVAFNVFVNQRHYGLLRFNGHAYVGCIPMHDGLIVADECGLRDWKTKVAQINKAAVHFQSFLTRTASLTNVIDASKSRQYDFFESIGVLPGDVHFMSPGEKNDLLAQYGEWLESQ